MPYTTNTYSGIFKPKNPQKYVGNNIDNITYRSSYELKFMNWCDSTKNVVQWNSEGIRLPYLSPIDSRMHEYVVDFLVTVENKDGSRKNFLVEVKPARFTRAPVIPKRKTRKYLNEVIQWKTDQAKWDIAKKYAQKQGWEFILITEHELGIIWSGWKTNVLDK